MVMANVWKAALALVTAAGLACLPACPSRPNRSRTVLPAGHEEPPPGRVSGEALEQPTVASVGAQQTVVVGRITLASQVPDPSEVLYSTCLTFVKYAVEQVQSGDYGEEELLAAFWGMRDDKLQPAARFKPGQRHRLTLEPLSDHPELLREMQADDTDDYALTPYWVIEYTSTGEAPESE